MYGEPLHNTIIMSSINTDFKHLGDYVREYILPAELTVTAAAKQLGVGRVALSNFLNGKSGLSANMANRLQKAFGANADDLLSMQASLKGKAERSVNQKKLASITPYEPPIAPIHASDIENWAKGIKARSDLPALLHQLVHSSDTVILQADFPAFDNAERNGWDGKLEVRQPTAWIPEGISRWEFSCEADPKGKAERDYQNRKQKITSEKSETTFVFVTPRKWPGKIAWADSKREEREWKDVRAYDASDLEQWLERSPGATLWLARKLGKPTQGYHSLTYYWDKWKSPCDPELTKALFKPNIEDHKIKFSEWLSAEPNKQLLLYADTDLEGLAFLHCMLEEADVDEHRVHALVFESAKALEMARQHPDKSLMLVASELNVRQEELLSLGKHFHCISIRSRSRWHPQSDGDDAKIQLGLPTSDDFEFALRDMGITDSYEINRLRRTTGCSPSILRRQLIPQRQDVSRSDWAESLESRHLIPFALAGRWEENCEGDKEILCELAGTKDYYEVENRLAVFKRLRDSPIWTIHGRLSGVASKMDVFYSIGHLVTSGTLRRFFGVAERILGPNLHEKSMSPDWHSRESKNFVRGDKPSAQLSRGICNSLVFLAAHGNKLFDKDLQEQIKVRTFQLVTNYIGDYDFCSPLHAHPFRLPEMAEASPIAFLDIVEEILVGDNLRLRFPTTSDRLPSIPHELLMALECLAWNKDYFQRISLILSALADYRIEGERHSSSNSALASLMKLFRLYRPQTSASADAIVTALQDILDKHPEIGRQLCKNILMSDIVDDSYRPLWRDDATGLKPLTIDGQEKIKQMAVETFLGLKRLDVSALKDMVDLLPSITDESARKQLWQTIESWAEKKQSDEQLEDVISRLRAYAHCLLAPHENVTELDKQRFKSVYGKIEPRDLVIRHRWLFTQLDLCIRFFSLLESGERAPDCFDNIVLEPKDALNEIWSQHKFSGILRLLRAVRHGFACINVGKEMFSVLEKDSVRIKFIMKCLSENHWQHNSDVSDCVKGLLLGADEGFKQVLVEKLGPATSPETLAEFLCCMEINHQTLKLVERQSNATNRHYWNIVSPDVDKMLSSPEINLVAQQFLEATRPFAAYNAVSAFRSWACLEDGLLLRLLQATIDTKGKFQGPQPVIHGNINDALGSLNERRTITEMEKAAMEFRCLVATCRIGFPNIESILCDSPEMYAWAICATERTGNLPTVQPQHQFIEAETNSLPVFSALIYSILTDMRLPGMDRNGDINLSYLSNWIARVRDLCRERNCVHTCDTLIGKLLSKPGRKEDDWPHPAICDVLEQLNSKIVDEYFVYAVYFSLNEPLVGDSADKQCINMADQYRKYAKNKRIHMKGLLEEIASMFEQKGKMLADELEHENQLHRIF